MGATSEKRCSTLYGTELHFSQFGHHGSMHTSRMSCPAVRFEGVTKLVRCVQRRVGEIFESLAWAIAPVFRYMFVLQATSRSFLSTLFQRTHNQPPILPAEAHRLVGHIGVPDRDSSATNDNCCFARTTCSIVQGVLDCRTFTY